MSQEDRQYARGWGGREAHAAVRLHTATVRACLCWPHTRGRTAEANDGLELEGLAHRACCVRVLENAVAKEREPANQSAENCRFAAWIFMTLDDGADVWMCFL